MLLESLSASKLAVVRFVVCVSPFVLVQGLLRRQPHSAKPALHRFDYDGSAWYSSVKVLLNVQPVCVCRWRLSLAFV